VAARRAELAQVGTIRPRLLKVGGLIRLSVRRVVIALSSLVPLQRLFAAALASCSAPLRTAADRAPVYVPSPLTGGCSRPALVCPPPAVPRIADPRRVRRGTDCARSNTIHQNRTDGGRRPNADRWLGEKCGSEFRPRHGEQPARYRVARTAGERPGVASA